MRIAASGLSLLFLAASTLSVPLGCSTRVEQASVAADSTVVYAGKQTGDVEARITFASRNKISKRTGRRLGVAQVFDGGEDKRVFGIVDLINQEARGDRPLNLHLVWLGPNEKVVFKRMIEHDPNGPDTTLSSALTLRGRNRPPGDYKLRVYLYRELIAERGFHLLGEEVGGVEEEIGGGAM